MEKNALQQPTKLTQAQLISILISDAQERHKIEAGDRQSVPAIRRVLNFDELVEEEQVVVVVQPITAIPPSYALEERQATQDEQEAP